MKYYCKPGLLGGKNVAHNPFNTARKNVISGQRSMLINFKLYGGINIVVKTIKAGKIFYLQLPTASMGVLRPVEPLSLMRPTANGTGSGRSVWTLTVTEQAAGSGASQRLVYHHFKMCIYFICKLSSCRRTMFSRWLCGSCIRTDRCWLGLIGELDPSIQ